MLKRILILPCLLILFIWSAAQEIKKDKTSLDFYGFVRNEFFVDTYKGLDAAYELFYVVPLYAGQDGNGNDINKQTSSNLSAIASRMGVKISGPEIFGATTSGNIEFDFGGIVKSEPTLFRIRHANMCFSWKKSRLLVGQTWHPFWGGGAFPIVAGLNTGSPFQAFNRSPQIRYDVKYGKLTVSGAGVYENQYTTKSMESGVFSSPNQAQRNGVIPEFVLSAEYNKGSLTLGGGAGLKRIKPRMTVTGTSGTFNADEYLTSTGFMAYLKHAGRLFTITAKGYYGQNMTHLTFLGGYGVATRDEASGKETYTSYTNYTTFVSMVYGKKWQTGLMLGYGGNLGTGDPLYEDTNGKAVTTGMLPDVQDLYRIAPHFALNVSRIRLIAEYEMTAANYGTGTFDFSDGLYADRHKAVNNRVIFMMTYFF